MFVVFRCWRPKLQIGPTILVSLECEGSHQRNGTSPICIHCMVFEIQLFFLLLWGPSSRKHGATTFWHLLHVYHQQCQHSCTLTNSLNLTILQNPMQTVVMLWLASFPVPSMVKLTASNGEAGWGPGNEATVWEYCNNGHNNCFHSIVCTHISWMESPYFT